MGLTFYIFLQDGEGKGDEAPNGGGIGGGSLLWMITTSTLLLAAGGGGGAGILQDGYPASLSITPNPSGGDYPTSSTGYGGNYLSNGGGGAELALLVMRSRSPVQMKDKVEMIMRMGLLEETVQQVMLILIFMVVMVVAAEPG